MNVIKPAYVDTALRTLTVDERRKVFSWFDHLKNWENDEHLRLSAKAMSSQDNYALTTPDDMRIFFTLDEAKGEIVIVDLARPSRFKLAGAASE